MHVIIKNECSIIIIVQSNACNHEKCIYCNWRQYSSKNCSCFSKHQKHRLKIYNARYDVRIRLDQLWKGTLTITVSRLKSAHCQRWRKRINYDVCQAVNYYTSLLYFFLQFRSLFAATCEASVVEAMWDVYFLEEDPFLLFFLALVMIINARFSVILLINILTKCLVVLKVNPLHARLKCYELLSNVFREDIITPGQEKSDILGKFSSILV